MRSLFAIVLVCALGLAGAAQAQRGQGQVMTLTAPAPSLEGNLLETPTEQTVAVYLPPSYERARARRYPVIFLLHGIFDSNRTWLNYVGAAAILDRLIAAGDIPEVIVVMPDGGNIYGGGFYRNSSVSGNWGDFITSDLVSFVDERFRTLARPGGRALAGWSMGGYGAIHLAMERPGLFSVIYAISPCCLAPVDDFGFGNDAWMRAYGFETPADLAAAMEANDFYSVAGIGVMTAFMPAPDAPPFYVDFPIDVARGQVVPDGPAYDRYLSLFPIERVARGREALTQLRAFGMEFGINDQFAHIPSATREFSQRLSELRVPHRLDVYEGDHRERVAERMESVILPYIAGALDRPE